VVVSAQREGEEGRVERELTLLRALASWLDSLLELALRAAWRGVKLAVMMREDALAASSCLDIIPKWVDIQTCIITSCPGGAPQLLTMINKETAKEPRNSNP
jgi:hypothetical protein